MKNKRYNKKSIIIYLDNETYDILKKHIKEQKSKNIKCNWHTLVVPFLVEKANALKKRVLKIPILGTIGD